MVVGVLFNDGSAQLEATTLFWKLFSVGNCESFVSLCYFFN